MKKDISHRDLTGYVQGSPLGMTGAANSNNAVRQAPQWLLQAHELVKSRFLEHLRLGEIAQTVGIHPVTLSREFRHFYDCTIGETVRRRRIDFACRELLQPQGSLVEIALRSGFYDQSHFVKTFKRLTGLTPTQYQVGGHLSQFYLKDVRE